MMKRVCTKYIQGKCGKYSRYRGTIHTSVDAICIGSLYAGEYSLLIMMKKTALTEFAASIPEAWTSVVVGHPGSSQLKVLRMDGAGYPDEVHPFDEALLVLEGLMNLRIDDATIEVKAGEVYMVPAGLPHSVAPGSHGTLVIIDSKT